MISETKTKEEYKKLIKEFKTIQEMYKAKVKDLHDNSDSIPLSSTLAEIMELVTQMEIASSGIMSLELVLDNKKKSDKLLCWF